MPAACPPRFAEAHLIARCHSITQSQVPAAKAICHVLAIFFFWTFSDNRQGQSVVLSEVRSIVKKIPCFGDVELSICQWCRAENTPEPRQPGRDLSAPMACRAVVIVYCVRPLTKIPLSPPWPAHLLPSLVLLWITPCYGGNVCRQLTRRVDIQSGPGELSYREGSMDGFLTAWVHSLPDRSPVARCGNL